MSLLLPYMLSLPLLSDPKLFNGEIPLLASTSKTKSTVAFRPLKAVTVEKPEIVEDGVDHRVEEYVTE